MSKRILLEDSFGTFRPERDQNGAIRASVMESTVVEGRTFTRIPGRFSMVGEVNGYGRRYGQAVWEKNLNEGSQLQESIKECSAFGLLEHPSDGHIDLRSPIAILVSKAQLQESGEVTGEITVLNTPEGQRLLALIEAGWDPRVSSRGFGSLVRAADGVDDVQPDFVCEGWDVVLKPSFKSAIMNPDRGNTTRTESKTPSFDYEKSLTEGQPAPAAMTFAERIGTIKTREDAKTIMNEGLATLDKRDADVEKAILENTSAGNDLKSAIAYHYAKVVVNGPWQEAKDVISKNPRYAVMHEALGKHSPEPAAPAAPANKPIQESDPQNNMNTTIESVRARIDALKRAANGESLSPADFATRMHEAQSLHNDVAGFLAEDSSQSWNAQKMHSEIQEAEKALESKILEASNAVDKLSTDKRKLLKVIEAVTKETVALKKKLGEQIAKVDAKNKVIEEVAKRGKFWKARAERMESRSNVLEGRLDMAYRVSDYVSERYKADTTRISAGHLLNEFAEELTKEEHAENKTVLESVANGEAPESIACLKDLMPIRESLANGGAPISEGNKPKEKPEPVTEGNKPKQKPEPEGSAGTLQEGEKKTKVRILDSKQRNPIDVSESASIARRLSESVN